MLKTGQDITNLYRKLETERAPWERHWQVLAEYIQPRKAQIESHTRTPHDEHHQKLYDTTGVLANLTLARGQLAWMTPRETAWFELSPRITSTEERIEDEVKDWLADCTDRMRIALGNSNFYTEIHELYLDRGGFGTGCIYVDWQEGGVAGAEPGLYFKCRQVGTYVCSEDGRGRINIVGCKHSLSARNALAEFGEKMLPPEVRKLAKTPDAWDQCATYVHMVFPRSDVARRSPFATDKAWASVWVHLDSQSIVRKSGYDTCPYLVTRFLTWPRIADSDSPYGWSPAWAALPDIKQLNHLEAMMDALADRQVNPPILTPDGMNTRVDLRPGGNTVFDANRPETIPREWVTQGRYDIGQIRAQEKRERVRKAFMVDLFEMFAHIDRQHMTATEINARLQEKIDQFSPTFDLLSTELLQPLVRRVFWLMLTRGQFAQPIPERILTPDPLTGELGIEEPQIQFNSRIALALQATQQAGALRGFQNFADMGLFAMRPEVLDNFDLDQTARDLFRHQGAPREWVKSEQERDGERQQRAQAQAAMMAANTAQP